MKTGHVVVRLRSGAGGAVFGSQIFVSRQQLLVHRPRDVGQDARQIHESPPPVQSAMGAIDRRKRVARDRRRGYAERGYCPRCLPFQFFDHTANRALRRAQPDRHGACGDTGQNAAPRCTTDMVPVEPRWRYLDQRREAVHGMWRQPAGLNTRNASFSAQGH
jgi:hypothetical protein